MGAPNLSEGYVVYFFEDESGELRKDGVVIATAKSPEELADKTYELVPDGRMNDLLQVWTDGTVKRFGDDLSEDPIMSLVGLLTEALELSIEGESIFVIGLELRKRYPWVEPPESLLETLGPLVRVAYDEGLKFATSDLVLVPYAMDRLREKLANTGFDTSSIPEGCLEGMLAEAIVMILEQGYDPIDAEGVPPGPLPLIARIAQKAMDSALQEGI